MDRNKLKLTTNKKMLELHRQHNNPFKHYKESLMIKINNWERNKEWFKTLKNSSIKWLKKTVSKYKNFMRKLGNSDLKLNSTTSMKSCPEPPKITFIPPKLNPKSKNTKNSLTLKILKSEIYKISMINFSSQKLPHKIKRLLLKMLWTVKSSNKNFKNLLSKDKLKRKNSNKKKKNSINKLTTLKKLLPQKLKRLSNWTTH